MNDKLAAKLKTLPNKAGVYFHKSQKGEIIYVGKAAVLKNRVRQYFQKTRDHDAKTLALAAFKPRTLPNECNNFLRVTGPIPGISSRTLATWRCRLSTVW